MDYAEVLSLNRALPELPLPPANMKESRREHLPAGLISFEDWRCFNYSYSDPSFGWRAADTLARSGTDHFPVYPGRAYKWIHRAYLLLRYGRMFANDPKIEPVKQACLIFADQQQSTRNVLEAMLVTHEETPMQLGKRLGIDGQIVEAFDALFYNVYDRKQDFLFLRNVVYPNTRLEELMEDYLAKSNLGDQLIRIGYNKKLASVLYFAGFREDLTTGISTQAATDMFRKTVMLQGHLLAANGFLNHAKHHVALLGARSILQSGLIGGTDTGGETSTGTLASLIQNEMYNAAAHMKDSVRRAAGL